MAAAGGSTTSLWWNLESCPLPSYVDPCIVATMASTLLRNFNINASMGNARGDCNYLDHYHFSAYGFFSQTQTELLQTLINSGIELHQLPPGKSNNEMEKMMMVDVLLWAMDTPPPANIIFIIGTMDFCYVFQKLRQKSYNVFLICQSMSEMPLGMLCGVNYCLGWLSFLRSLHNEQQQSHFPEPNEQKSPMASPGGRNPSPKQKTRSKGKPRAEPDPKASADDVQKSPMASPGWRNPSPNQKTRSKGKPRAEPDPKASADDVQKSPMASPGWRNPSRNQKTRSKGKPRAEPDPKASADDVQKSPMASPGGRNPTPNQKTRSKGKPRAEPDPKASADDVRKFGYYMPGPQGFLMAERIEQHTGQFPKFPNFNQSKKPRSPVSSESTTEETKLASLEEFKAWLTVVVNDKKYAEGGYNFSPFRVDFKKATGKILDEKFLGFSKIRKLLENCNDIVVIKEVKRGRYLAFPVKPNE